MTVPTHHVMGPDDLCDAFRDTLVEHLPGVIEALGYDDLKTVSTWEQVPTLRALTAANLPAGAFESPGLVSPPTRSGGTHDATWRIIVGLWDRDRDFTRTSRRVARWAKAVRVTALQHRSLGGVATGLRWVGEEYDRIPNRDAARTLGGCSVIFDVDAENVVDLTPLSPAVPVVRSTHPAVTVRAPQE